MGKLPFGKRCLFNEKESEKDHQAMQLILE
jgi:hypothetical protein